MSKIVRSVLITGCSPGGIGHALAREFHSHGLRVFATARTVKKIADLQDLGIECFELVVDDHESVTRCFEEVEWALRGQGLDYLVNNAGRLYNHPATETSLPLARSLLETNFLSIIDINQTFLPLLLPAHGTTIHIGSIGSLLPIPWASVYSASKAALHAYCNALRLELAPLGVRVLYVQAGEVRTNVVRDRPFLGKASRYAAMNDEFRERLEIDAASGISPEAFGRELVARVLGGGCWWREEWEIWAGGKARLVRGLRWVAGWWPWDVVGWVVRREFKLRRLEGVGVERSKLGGLASYV